MTKVKHILNINVVKENKTNYDLRPCIMFVIFFISILLSIELFK